MHTGMGWLNNANLALAENIRKAGEYYKNKYGRLPELCFVHPSMLRDSEQVAGITVRPWRYILPGNLWIGIEDMPTAESESA